MLPALALLVTWILLGIPVALVGIPWTLLSGSVDFLYHAALTVTGIGLRVAGIRVRAEWRAPFDPSHRAIFLSNHISNLDPPVLLPLLPGRVSAFVKRSIMSIPVLGYGMRLANFIPVDRDGRVESAVESVQAARQVLASGVHMLSFVEGTRSRDGRLQAFKKGPFYLAMETGAPVIPVSIYGTESMMKKGSLRIVPGTAHVIFHAPLDPRQYATRDDLMFAVRAAIASGLPDWMRNDSE
ncbi:MAG TPA: lysophospholipid acyltransferase family protein [Acidobacteriaceae bacterium]|jgi:1-acyl-sn-glycerol-3-phosphate acyltransferase|nr:lysophospholipid acyltransferase family protein [Acidobacteriaceae bacterium]